MVRSSAPTPQPMNDGSLHTHTSEMPSRAPAPKKLPLFMSSRAPAPIKLPLPSWKYYRTIEHEVSNKSFGKEHLAPLLQVAINNTCNCTHEAEGKYCICRYKYIIPTDSKFCHQHIQQLTVYHKSFFRDFKQAKSLISFSQFRTVVTSESIVRIEVWLSILRNVRWSCHGMGWEAMQPAA